MANKATNVNNNFTCLTLVCLLSYVLLIKQRKGNALSFSVYNLTISLIRGLIENAVAIVQMEQKRIIL